MECISSSDTATCYKNEQHLGDSLIKFLPTMKLRRDDVFITTKLSKWNLFYNDCSFIIVVYFIT